MPGAQGPEEGGPEMSLDEGPSTVSVQMMRKSTKRGELRINVIGQNVFLLAD